MSLDTWGWTVDAADPTVPVSLDAWGWSVDPTDPASTSLVDNELIVESDEDGSLSPIESFHPWAQPLDHHLTAVSADDPTRAASSGLTSAPAGQPGTVITAPTDFHQPAIVETEAGRQAVDVSVIDAVHPGDHILIQDGAAVAIV